MRGPPPQYQQGPDMMNEMPPAMGGQQVLRWFRLFQDVPRKTVADKTDSV